MYKRQLLESVRVVVYLLPFHSSSIVFAEPDDLLQKLGMVAWFCTPVSYTHLYPPFSSFCVQQQKLRRYRQKKVRQGHTKVSYWYHLLFSEYPSTCLLYTSSFRCKFHCRNGFSESGSPGVKVLQPIFHKRVVPVSYTPLDVYKRQILLFG